MTTLSKHTHIVQDKDNEHQASKCLMDGDVVLEFWRPQEQSWRQGVNRIFCCLVYTGVILAFHEGLWYGYLKR